MVNFDPTIFVDCTVFPDPLLNPSCDWISETEVISRDSFHRNMIFNMTDSIQSVVFIFFRCHNLPITKPIYIGIGTDPINYLLLTSL
jgi:hypothetical protein